MIEFLRSIYINSRFYLAMGGAILLMVLSFALPLLFPVAVASLLLIAGLVIAEIIVFYRNADGIACERHAPAVFSLGAENTVSLILENTGTRAFALTIYDEVPYQLQWRDFRMSCTLEAGSRKELSYQVRPMERGVFTFGNTNIFLSARIGLLQKRVVAAAVLKAAVYPSLQELRKHQINSVEKASTLNGNRRQKKLGHSYEFDQIKNYVTGDDLRSVNWKATGRRNKLMVNHYIEERSQQIYFLLDKSRVMRMPFDGLSLLDYSVNSVFALSNVVLMKGDKAGMIAFSSKIDSVVKAGRTKVQLSSILKSLYSISEYKLEANYEMLFLSIKQLVKTRSLLFIYTNFESLYGLQRVLPILKKINKHHLLVCVFFENTEISAYCKEPAETLEDIYMKAFAEQALIEKKQIILELQRNGIQGILTKPQDLSAQSINKYLELKSRGLI